MFVTTYAENKVCVSRVESSKRRLGDRDKLILIDAPNLQATEPKMVYISTRVVKKKIINE